jgi:ATP-dependent Zn protease
MGNDELAPVGPPAAVDQASLSREWRRLGRAATFVAVLTSPGFFSILYFTDDWPLFLAIVVTIFAIAAFRGLVDVVAHKFIPRPSLYAADEQARKDDVLYRRRRWYWRTRYRRATILAVFLVPLLVFHVFGWLGDQLSAGGPQLLIILLQLPLLFFINFGILFGPLLMFSIMQMKAFEPGDSDWGVKLSDVRGQKEPKEEVNRIITLWQAGDEFKKAGGKPERGLLLIGAPGTGKTMLSKGIATSFNSPIMTMPGSGFAATFIGMDVATVLILIARARRLARKWGGTCMIFIDEIDAVGMRRQALGAGAGMGYQQLTNDRAEDHMFYGPWGAMTSSGDVILETRAWRERIFANRAPVRTGPYPPTIQNAVDRINNIIMPGGMGMGGQGLALNQLLVQMDGMDSPPAMRKYFTKRFNTFLDALYVIPTKLGGFSLRLRPPKPRAEQVYFIGATNVPLEVLDPALIRPGRMGRHIHFRTPTAVDRKDIFDLYLGKVQHDADLDSERRRDELARITGGYSPAMIEQVCSMALTYAHSDGRPNFAWPDIIEAMTTIESGTAIGVDYIEEETRAVAIHEAGHAAASHVYAHDVLSTRLSIRMRGGSLGHHQAIEKDERFSSFRHEEVGGLVWVLGAMAAEHVFYGENSRGVSGDLNSATTIATLMVGVWGMGPEPIDLKPLKGETPEQLREREEKYMARFEQIGRQVMNRSRNAATGDSLAGVLGDPAKVRSAARILGQAYLTALCLIRHNREQVARIADTLVERKELHGDEVVELLEAAGLEAPVIDLTDETIWPRVS